MSFSFDRRFVLSLTYHGAGELVSGLEGREVDRDLARLAALALLRGRGRSSSRSSGRSRSRSLSGGGVLRGRRGDHTDELAGGRRAVTVCVVLIGRVGSMRGGRGRVEGSVSERVEAASSGPGIDRPSAGGGRETSKLPPSSSAASPLFKLTRRARGARRRAARARCARSC
jgi:hypothetical protein